MRTSTRIPIPRHESLLPTEPTFPDMGNIYEGGLRQIKDDTKVIIGGIEVFEKDLYKAKIENFKSFFPAQPSFYISYQSWQRLIAGKYENDEPWLPDNYEVYAFVFCIVYEKGSKSLYFRIRTIIRRKKVQINFTPDNQNNDPLHLRQNWNSNIPHITGNNPLKPYTNEVYLFAEEIEIGNIAYVDLNQAIQNKINGTTYDCVRFLRDTDEGLHREDFLKTSDINIGVQYWKNELSNLWNKYSLVSYRSIFKTKRAEFNTFDFNEIPTHLDDVARKPNLNNQQQIKPLMLQEGAIFSKDRIAEIINTPETKGKYTKIDFALDFLEEAVPNAKKMINPIKFVFNINPAFVTDGLPCPAPSAC